MTVASPHDIVLPSHDDDPVSAGAVTALGGPVGRHARLGAHSFWTPLRIIIVLALLTVGLAWAQKAACRDPFSWGHEHQYTHLCYSDVTALYYAEHLNEGATPYVDHPVEYPVVIGGAMWVAAGIAKTLPGVPQRHEAEAFFDITALMLAACLLVVVILAAKVAGRRPWDAALIALAPAMVIHAYTNWDLLAAAALALAIHAWARRHPVASGIWVAVGLSTKLYPALLLVVLLPLCLRARQMRAWVQATAAAAVTFIVINAPVYFAANKFSQTQDGSFVVDPSGENAWLKFWTLNKQRPADWDSLWYMLQRNLVNVGDGKQVLIKVLVAIVVAIAVALFIWSVWTLCLPVRADGYRDWMAPSLFLGGVAALLWHFSSMGLGALVLHALAVVAIASALRTLLRREHRTSPSTWFSFGFAALEIAAWKAGFASDGVHLLRRVLGHEADNDFASFDPGSGTPHALNAGVFWLTVVVVLSVIAVAWDAPERPRVPQLMFLAVAGFLLVNKVDSPQYVIWLIPLAVLARPRWRAFLVWQFAELAVLVTRFYFFINNDNANQGIGYGWFATAVAVRDIALVVVMVLVVRDIYAPDLDVVRRDGADDPAGGVLDGAPEPALAL